MRVWFGNKMTGRLVCCLLLLFVSFFCASCGKKEAGDHDGQTSSGEPVPTQVHQATPLPTIEADVQEIMLENVFFRRMNYSEKEERSIKLNRPDGTVLTADEVIQIVDGRYYDLYSLDLYDEAGNKVFRYFTEEDGDTFVRYQTHHGETIMVGAGTSFYCPWVDLVETEPDTAPAVEDLLKAILSKRGTVDGEDAKVRLTEYTCVGGCSDIIAEIAGLHIVLSSAAIIPGTLLSDQAFQAYETMTVSKRELPVDESPVYYSDWRGKWYEFFLSGDDVTMKSPDGEEICATGDSSVRWAGEEPFLRKNGEYATVYGIPLDEFLDSYEDPYADEVGARPFTSFKTQYWDDFVWESGLGKCFEECDLADATYRYTCGSLILFWEQENGEGWWLGDNYQLFYAGDGESVDITPNCTQSFRNGDEYYSGYLFDDTGNILMNNLYLSVSKNGTDKARLDLYLEGLPFENAAATENIADGFPKDLRYEAVKDPKTGRLIREIYYAGSSELARIHYLYVEKEAFGDTACRIAFGYIRGVLYGKGVQFCKKENPQIIIYTGAYFNPIIQLGEPFSFPENDD